MHISLEKNNMTEFTSLIKCKNTTRVWVWDKTEIMRAWVHWSDIGIKRKVLLDEIRSVNDEMQKMLTNTEDLRIHAVEHVTEDETNRA